MFVYVCVRVYYVKFNDDIARIHVGGLISRHDRRARQCQLIAQNSCPMGQHAAIIHHGEEEEEEEGGSSLN